jgi:DNA-binding CsgD family transcriptional regulator
MGPALKLVTAISRTKSLASKDNENLFFPVNLLSLRDAGRAGNHPDELYRHRGGKITGRERDVLAMISQGCSNKWIARTLDISPETVKSHIKHIFLKLEVTTRTEAVVRALSLELL